MLEEVGEAELARSKSRKEQTACDLRLGHDP